MMLAIELAVSAGVIFLTRIKRTQRHTKTR